MIDDIENNEFDQTMVDFVDKMDEWIIIIFFYLLLTNTNKYLSNILSFTFNKEYYLKY